MELNLLPILNFDGRKMQIAENVALVAVDCDTFRFAAPVIFEGEATNVSGTIELTGRATAQLELVCDRCTDSFTREIVCKIDEKLKKEDSFSAEEENPDYITISGTSVDLGEILYTNVFMALPSKTLCSDDCKGLCEVCGKNLNLGDCGCKKDDTDPRFDILDKLL